MTKRSEDKVLAMEYECMYEWVWHIAKQGCENWLDQHIKPKEQTPSWIVIVAQLL
jgi:hypothetical protein